MSKYTRTEIPGEWTRGNNRSVVLDPTALYGQAETHFYVGIPTTNDDMTQGNALVSVEDFLTGLAEFLGKRITVADVEVIPATVTVKNEVVYGV